MYVLCNLYVRILIQLVILEAAAMGDQRRVNLHIIIKLKANITKTENENDNEPNNQTDADQRNQRTKYATQLHTGIR